ncbi:hypothetical protein ETAA8_28650 [Anatilimnocola aggregata]|uniref:Uncharacterized protein n=1 Tax=Anatilimnocola aggregata TaxID=2528021 RepID=A0A517YC24_9BACT|nr:hypothetical protein ETAA8_28650 [Anatilimnocola aggregata]
MDERIYDIGEAAHSSEAYYSNVYFDNSNLVIPYVNFGLVEHPLNPRSDRAIYVDFAYILCTGLVYLKVLSGVLLGRREDAGHILYFGGLQMDGPPELIDFEVGCKSAYVYLLPDSRLSNSIWVAVDGPLRNLDAETVAAFFRAERMPESIRRFMD